MALSDLWLPLVGELLLLQAKKQFVSRLADASQMCQTEQVYPDMPNGAEADLMNGLDRGPIGTGVRSKADTSAHRC